MRLSVSRGKLCSFLAWFYEQKNWDCYFSLFIAVFENQNHDLIETVFAVGIAAFPVKNEDKDKK